MDDELNNECSGGESTDLCKMDDRGVEIEYVDETLHAAPAEDESRSLAVAGGDSGLKARVDALIHMAGGIAAAVPGKDAVLVKFPPGKGWNDLADSAAMDGAKRLFTKGANGKIDGQASLVKAGLKANPAAIANLALQGAAVVVGQAYMTEINSRLEGIESGIKRLERWLEREMEAELEGDFRLLKSYAIGFDEYSSDVQKRQAVINKLEDIKGDSLRLWSFQLSSMRDLKKELENDWPIDVNGVNAKIADLKEREDMAVSAYQLWGLTERASMQYDNDFSTCRLERVRSEAETMLGEYGWAREEAINALRGKIDGVMLPPIAIADERALSEEPANPIHEFFLRFGEIADRMTPLALIEEGARRNEEEKDRLRKQATEGDAMQGVAQNQRKQLEDLDYIYNKATAMLITEGEIRFIEE